MDDGIVDALATSNRVSLYLLESIPPEALGATAGGKGRTVGAMFAHLHSARLMWLDPAAKDLAATVSKIDQAEAGDRALLAWSLEASGEAIAELVRRAVRGGRIVGFKRSPAAFVGYLVAHDGYHWGEIGIALAQSGRPLDRKVAYGMWEWGVR